MTGKSFGNGIKSFTISNGLSKVVSKAIIILYIVSLLLPAYTHTPGFFALIFGGLSFLWLGPAVIAWSANVLFFLVLFKKNYSPRIKRLLSGIGALCGLCALFVTELPVHEGSSTTPVSIGMGFYIWETSLLLLFLKSVSDYNKSKEQQGEDFLQ
ncbi:hypothetical protein AB9P05_22290 [Roseivirga sp. BDSF3-8]|uniref:hypothetical protein n=1 Tax=Roseivirga sp. BDSF3-8 TaxID=3241598 RepID=UPI00353238EC